MQIASTSTPPQPIQLREMAVQLHDAAGLLVSGAAVMRSADLSGDDWSARFDQATAEASELWKPAFAGRAALAAAAKELDASTPAGAAGRDAVLGALAVANRELDNMGRIYMQYSVAPAQRRAVAAAGAVASSAERIVVAYTTAEQRLIELAGATT